MPNKKNTVEEFVKQEKQAATIKVVTIWKAIAILAVIIVSFIGGHQVAVQDNYHFESATTYKAEQLVEKLKATQ